MLDEYHLFIIIFSCYFHNCTVIADKIDSWINRINWMIIEHCLNEALYVIYTMKHLCVIEMYKCWNILSFIPRYFPQYKSIITKEWILMFWKVSPNLISDIKLICYSKKKLLYWRIIIQAITEQREPLSSNLRGPWDMIVVTVFLSGT